MSNFERVLEFLFDNEGGFSDHPLDRGGKTNLGITLNFLRKYKPNATEQDLRNLTHAEAADIYKQEFWDKNRLDELPFPLSMLVFDQAVNSGNNGIKNIQRAVFGATALTKIDGIMGNMTIEAIKGLDPRATSLSFIKEVQHFYVRLVARDTSQIVFLKGWLNRSHKYLDILFKE